jgi:hypothetical protein
MCPGGTVTRANVCVKMSLNVYMTCARIQFFMQVAVCVWTVWSIAVRGALLFLVVNDLCMVDIH